MCGIAGIISQEKSLISKDALQKMGNSLAHRGPDGETCWISISGHAGFAHRRLSVIDLSPAGAQPMHYANGRYTIVYNGEIYNYMELKAALRHKGYSFKNESDTEVILAMYDLHKEKCLSHFDGMFAFAIWDAQEQSLFCARDRFGEKPFFYLLNKGKTSFYFGSEMKALTAAGIKRNINHSLLLQYIAHGYVSDPGDPLQTFDSNIQKLPPAHFCTYLVQEGKFSVTRYWEIDKRYRVSITEKDAVDRFSGLLSGSVEMQLRSDVSVGTSLSGGLDSSAVAAIIGQVRPGTMFKTFTASFPGYQKDESFHARDVAEKCGFENYSIAPSADDLMRDLEKLMYHQEEPFTSSSVYAQYRVFELAKSNGIVVLLDGQGADETLAGYDKYRCWFLRSILPGTTASILQQREIKKLINNKDIDPGYIDAWGGSTKTFKPVVRSLNDMLQFNTFQSGLEELLRYADRNSMAHGREIRLPFLNHQLVSFVFSLPDHFKINNGWTKWILRKAMNNYLPRHIVWQKKKIGFEPPQKAWMQQNQVKEYIREAKAKLAGEGVLNKKINTKMDKAHGAYEEDAADWRYLSAYLFYNAIK
jgi:asparagine synthase (glutamine-hydrolysing)